MHARARDVEISTYAYLDKLNQNRSQIPFLSFTHTTGMTHFLEPVLS